MAPLVSWSGWGLHSPARDRSKLSAVSRFTDDEIDVLYKALAAFDKAAPAQARAEERSSLVKRIEECERERAAEMSALFWNRNPVRPEQLTELFEKLDGIFKDR